MVEIPDDAARDDAQWLRTFWMMDETLSPGAIDRAKRVADRLDPPKPPPDEQDTESTRTDGIDTAWGLIANAYGGNWELASDEWRDAAERWRDENLKSPPPTLVERMVEASRRSGFGDSAEDGMVRALAVVRAAVEGLRHNGATPYDGLVYLDDVIKLLGGDNND